MGGQSWIQPVVRGPAAVALEPPNIAMQDQTTMTNEYPLARLWHCVPLLVRGSAARPPEKRRNWFSFIGRT